MTDKDNVNDEETDNLENHQEETKKTDGERL